MAVRLQEHLWWEHSQLGTGWPQGSRNLLCWENGSLGIVMTVRQQEHSMVGSWRAGNCDDVRQQELS